MSERNPQAIPTVSGPPPRRPKPYFFTREIRNKFSPEEIAAAKAWYLEHGHKAGSSQNYDPFLAKLERGQKWVKQRESGSGADHEYHRRSSEAQREEFTGDESESRLSFEGAKPTADEQTSDERLQHEVERTGEDILLPDVLSDEAQEFEPGAGPMDVSPEDVAEPTSPSPDPAVPEIVCFLEWLASRFHDSLAAYFQFKDDIGAGVARVKALAGAARNHQIAHIESTVVGIELWLRAAYPDLVHRLEFESVLRRALGDFRKDAEWAKISSAPVIHDYIAPEPSLVHPKQFLPVYGENGFAFREHRGGRWRLVDFGEPVHDPPKVVAERKTRAFTSATVRKRKRALENGLVKFLDTAPADVERDRMSRLVDLVGQGLTDDQVAAALGVGKRTVYRLKKRLSDLCC